MQCTFILTGQRRLQLSCTVHTVTITVKNHQSGTSTVTYLVSAHTESDLGVVMLKLRATTDAIFPTTGSVIQYVCAWYYRQSLRLLVISLCVSLGCALTARKKSELLLQCQYLLSKISMVGLHRRSLAAQRIRERPQGSKLRKTQMDCLML